MAKSSPSLSKIIERNVKSMIDRDPYLARYADALANRMKRTDEAEKRLTGGRLSLPDFASGHEYFGLHFRDNEWIFREWAPNAVAVSLVGEKTGWREDKKFALDRINDDGVWQITFPADRLEHGDLYRLRIHWPGGDGDRIPAYARRVVQDDKTKIFNAQVWHPAMPYQWKHALPDSPPSPVLIYESHVGMAQEEEKVGTYREFTEKVLPRIIRGGYNVIELMAVQEHPYYGSFGYQVSSFFAASSRFGTPEELKELIDTAHASGLRVIMDIIHSHAAQNEVEGISRFDGTDFQYFHSGPRGLHEAWGSRTFDYGKLQVCHFLLSNCRYWLDEYRFDGFRFDGVTSMLYLHHGLGKSFTSYEDYFGPDVDQDALVYLGLANKLIHEIRPDAISVAEDVSGMPALALPAREGGIGFDYRFAMGVPDYWIKIIKELPDEEWPISYLWFELNNRRKDERTISYAESHDQALVGDQTLIFRLIGSEMYFHMRVDDSNWKVDRGIALHKMIRLITLATADAGYLNFMGNEFGHPEWIDFPREGNNWSYRYARRQWHLAEDDQLRYHFLDTFDRDMIALAKRSGLVGQVDPSLVFEHAFDKVIAFERAGLLLVFNFHPTRSFLNYRFGVKPGAYRMVLDSDAGIYGGFNRLEPGQTFFTIRDGMRDAISLYLPTRTCLALEWTG